MVSRIVANIFVCIRVAFVLLFVLRSLEGKEAGGGAGDIWNFSAGARSLALGNAVVGLVDDATAGYWNPSRLTHVRAMNLNVLHAPLLEGASYDYLGLAYPTLENGTWGSSLVRLGLSGTERRDADNNILGTYGFSVTGFALSWGKAIARNLSLGGAAKYLRRDIAGYSSGIASLNLGADYRIKNRASVSLVLRDAAQLAIQTDDRMTFNTVLGASYEIIPGALRLAFQLEQAGPTLAAGLEYGWGPAAFRFGLGDNLRGGGVGFRLGGFQFDYAVSVHELGSFSRFSMGAFFGENRFKKKTELVTDYMTQSEEAYRSGDFVRGLELMSKAFNLEPHNPTIFGRKRRLETIVDSYGFKKKALAKPKDDADIETKAQYVIMVRTFSGYTEGEIEVAVDALGYIAHAEKYLAEGRFDLAARAAEEASRLDPYSSIALERLGTAYFTLGFLKKAKEAWGQALELNPTNQDLRYFMSQHGLRPDQKKKK